MPRASAAVLVAVAAAAAAAAVAVVGAAALIARMFSVFDAYDGVAILHHTSQVDQEHDDADDSSRLCVPV